MAAIAYYILVRTLLTIHSKDSPMAIAIGRDIKGKVSLLLYAMAILSCLLTTFIGRGLILAVALVWFVPDKRIEKILSR